MGSIHKQQTQKNNKEEREPDMQIARAHSANKAKPSTSCEARRELFVHADKAREKPSRNGQDNLVAEDSATTSGYRPTAGASTSSAAHVIELKGACQHQSVPEKPKSSTGLPSTSTDSRPRVMAVPVSTRALEGAGPWIHRTDLNDGIPGCCAVSLRPAPGFSARISMVNNAATALCRFPPPFADGRRYSDKMFDVIVSQIPFVRWSHQHADHVKQANVQAETSRNCSSAPPKEPFSNNNIEHQPAPEFI